MATFRHWTPTVHVSTAQLVQLNKANKDWPTGPEGGAYDTGDGIRSSSFNVVWLMLGMVSRGYPVYPTEQQKQHMHDFLINLGHVLPCGACRSNFDTNIAHAGYHPTVHLASRQAFSRFINHFHNVINTMLGKPHVQYEIGRDMIESLRARCTKGSKGREGGCAGARVGGGNVKATCVVGIVSEVQAKKLGGRLVIDDECRIDYDHVVRRSPEPRRSPERRRTRSNHHSRSTNHSTRRSTRDNRRNTRANRRNTRANR